MRFVYLDESGVGDPKREPFLVVAGVIVHADIQLKAIEKYLASMVECFVPPDKKEGFFFHARELANGGGAFDRNSYPEVARLVHYRNCVKYRNSSICR